MIDTVRVWFPAPLERPSEFWDEHLHSRGNAVQWLVKKERESGHTLKTVYTLEVRNFSAALMRYRGNPPRVSVEGSLPRYVQGHNLRLLTVDECWDALTELHTRIKGRSERIHVPDLEEWRFTRLDLAHDWTVDDPDAYIHDLHPAATVHASHGLRHYVAARDRGEGWNTGNRYWRQQLYNKVNRLEQQIREHPHRLDREEDDSEAPDWVRLGFTGYRDPHNPKEEIPYYQRYEPMADADLRAIAHEKALRYEVTLFSEHLRQSVLGDAVPTLGTVFGHLRSVGRRDLRRKWERLTRHWHPSGEANVRELLTAKYGPTKAASYTDLWLRLVEIGKEQYLARSGMERRALDRKIDAMQAAGVSLNRNYSLKKLDIPDFPV